MKIKVKFFARYREQTGTKEAELEVQAGTTITELKELIEEHFPQLKSNVSNLVITVNSEFANSNQVLKEGDEIAFLPPFSGG